MICQKIGKEDAEVYVDTGKWKARQGGNGLRAAGDVKLNLQIVQQKNMLKFIVWSDHLMMSWLECLFRLEELHLNLGKIIT